MYKCPAIEDKAFDRLHQTDEEAVQKGFGRLASKLHGFLNNESLVRDLQSRRTWTKPRDPEAFHNFKTEPEHWYTFSHGGRNEAQLNVGMFPDRLRIGLGFEFTEKEHGDPKKVRLCFTAFLNAVRDRPEAFQGLVQEVPLEMEFFPARGGGLDVLRPGAVLPTLLDLPRDPTWLFIGRMLRRDADHEVLGDGAKLGLEIDRVFLSLLPWWSVANRAS